MINEWPLTPSRGDTRMKLYFVAEFTKNSGQTTLEGGQGGSGDNTTARNRSSFSDGDDKKKKVVSF